MIIDFNYWLALCTIFLDKDWKKKKPPVALELKTLLEGKDAIKAYTDQESTRSYLILIVIFVVLSESDLATHFLRTTERILLERKDSLGQLVFDKVSINNKKNFIKC